MAAFLGVVMMIAGLGVERAVAQETKRVVVQSFRGPSSGPARNHVVVSLREQREVELVPSDAFDGLSGSALRDAAADAQVSAIIQGRVSKKGKLLTVHVSVHDAASGELVHEESWTKKKPQLDDIQQSFWSRVGPHIMRTQAPAKRKEPEPVVTPKRAEPAPEKPRPVAREREREREPEPAEKRAPSERSGRATDDTPPHPVLVVTAGPRLLWRRLAYDGATTLNSYSSYSGAGNTGPGFTLALNVQWFPGAHARRDWPSDIGIELDGDYSFLKSTQGAKELKTKAYELSGALMYRLPLDSFEPRFRVGYLLHRFDVQAPDTAQLPGVTYGSLRIGVGTLIHFVRAFSMDIGASYLAVLTTGEFGKKRYAEDLSAYGWEIGGGATYRFKDAYGIRVGAEFRRYGLDMGKSENNRIVLPKRGYDDFLRLTLSFVYALEGK